MKLFGAKDIDNRFDSPRAHGPQNEQAKEQGGSIELVAQSSRHGGQGNDKDTGQVKDDRPHENGPVISKELVRQKGSQKGCRVRHRDRDGTVRGCRDGVQVRVPVFIVHARHVSGLCVVDAVEGKAFAGCRMCVNKPCVAKSYEITVDVSEDIFQEHKTHSTHSCYNDSFLVATHTHITHHTHLPQSAPTAPSTSWD